MEYGIWNLHAATRLWGDPRLVGRHPILAPGATEMLPRAAFALSALQRSTEMPVPLALATVGPPYGTLELTSKPTGRNSASPDNLSQLRKSDNNERNIERTDDDNDQQVKATNKLKSIISPKHCLFTASSMLKILRKLSMINTIIKPKSNCILKTSVR